MNRSIIALAAALAAGPALAAQDDYPPGLFENSPVVPSGPPNAVAPSQPPDAGDSFGPPDAIDPLDDYCEGLASRTFRSLAEVKRAHAKCDQARGARSSGHPPRTSQTSEGTGTREPAVTGRAADAGERHPARPAFLSRPPPTTPSARRCPWTRPLWPIRRWAAPTPHPHPCGRP